MQWLPRSGKCVNKANGGCEPDIAHHRDVHSPGTEYRPPPPSVILDGQLEVGQGQRDGRGDAEKDRVDDKEDAVEGVLFSAPQGRKDVVQLNGDRTEGRQYNTIQTMTTDTQRVLKLSKGESLKFLGNLLPELLVKEYWGVAVKHDFQDRIPIVFLHICFTCRCELPCKI